MSDYAQAQYIIDEIQKVNGLPPDNMRSMTATPGDKKVLLNFLEPEDTVIDDQLLCTVKGVVVVRKEGSMPESMTDGVVVLRNENLGAYETEPFVDEGLENDREYYYRFFPYSDHSVYNPNMENTLVVSTETIILYGIRINKSDSNPATRIEYLEQAAGMTPAKMDYDTGKFDYGSWNPDEIWFLKDNYPAMVKYDGTEDYKLDPDDYSKKADGSASDVSNASYEGNAMAKIPLVWLYQYEDEEYEYCYISNKQVNDNYHAYAHQREDGSIMDYIWLSCFEGRKASVFTGSGSFNVIRSIKGGTPINTVKGTDMITYATNNGDLWYIRTWAQRNLINMLLMIMSRSDDSQTSFGYGYHKGGTGDKPNYLALGSGYNKGRFYGSKADRDVVKVFHIENWWGNIKEIIAGLIYGTAATASDVRLWVKMVKPYNTTGEGYVDTGIQLTSLSGMGYISEFTYGDCTGLGRLPLAAYGSSTTYACDEITYSNSTLSNHYAHAGGYSIYPRYAGAWALDLDHSIDGATDWMTSAALSCEQPRDESTSEE